MWKHQKAPHPPVLLGHAKQITDPLKAFTTWELASRHRDWLRVLLYSRTAQDSYSRAVSKFCVYIGDKPLADVTHHDVRDFLLDITRRDTSIQCANRFLNGLRSFFDFLYLGGVVDTVAPRFIRGRKYKGPLPRAVSEANIKRLISAAGTLRNKTIIELMYATGCRAGEIVAMRLEDIHFQKRTVIVRGKGIRPVVELIGMEWYGWHGFRRGIASNLYELGADEKIVQRVLRHAKAHVTKDRYIKAFDPAVLAAMKRMETTLDAMKLCAPTVHQIN
ncbi:MAG: tyrosine-type recombinase/integrase [Candidatus Acidiferrum sp.]